LAQGMEEEGLKSDQRPVAFNGRFLQ